MLSDYLAGLVKVSANRVSYMQTGSFRSQRIGLCQEREDIACILANHGA